MSSWARCLLLAPLLLSGCMGSDTLAPVISRSQHLGPKPTLYTVHVGDTLYSIAFSFGMDYRLLASLNGIKPPYAIQPGERLCLKGGAPVVARPRAVSRAPVKAATTPKRATYTYSNQRPDWQWPTAGNVLYRFGKTNKGIDIAGRYQQPVRASAAGVVVYAGHGIRGYDNLLIIRHNDQYLTAYAYNSRLLVREGAMVRRGQTIAAMGQNRNRRSVLHFEIRRSGKPVNPLRYLPKR